MIQSHLTAALLFSLVTSAVFAITGKETDRERLLNFVWLFSLFVIVTLAASWLMNFGHR
ncbi:MAG: hypothetical protein HYX72_08630 [Acidobacteria bacterium]|nr:hypothetical protein [Acidobacteriota bacterium]